MSDLECLAWIEKYPLENIPTLLRRLAVRLEPVGAAPVEPDQRLVSAPTVAEHLAVPLSWVRSETRAGRLPHLKAGRYLRYRIAEVEASIAARSKL